MEQLARRLTRSGDWEEVLQESVLNAWRKRAQFDSARGAPRVWLLAIVADQARKSNRRRRLFGSDGRDSAQQETVDWTDRLGITLAVRELPPRQRLAVELYYYLDLPVSEVAEVMRCSQGTVKSTLADARKRLRSTIGTETS
jgi:RNA polymerase sigma-70 factor (ECF subfamily)